MFFSHIIKGTQQNVYGGITLYSLPGSTVGVSSVYNIRIPDNVTKIAAVAIGAGGGGGGASSAASAAAGGGGGGALSYSNAITVTPGETLTITVPNQSAAGASSGSNGGTGNTASISRSGTTLLSAVGGSGSVGVTGGTATVGANGGAAASGVGDVKYSGGKGGNGEANNDCGGGGGGAAGYAGNGGIGGSGISGNIYGANGFAAATGSGAGAGGASFNNSSIGGPGGGTLWYGKQLDGAIGVGGAGANELQLAGKLGSSFGSFFQENFSVYTSPLPASGNVDNVFALPGGGGAGAPSGGVVAYAGMRGAGGAVRIIWGQGTTDWGTSTNTYANRLSLRSSATSSTNSIIMPKVELGDTVILIDLAVNTSGIPTAVVPTGFTQRLNTSSGTTLLTTYYRQILSANETGSTLTCSNGTQDNAKILLIISGRMGASFGTQGTDTVLNGAINSAGSLGTVYSSSLSVDATDSYTRGIPLLFSFMYTSSGISSNYYNTINTPPNIPPLEIINVSGPNNKSNVVLAFFPQEINFTPYNITSYFPGQSANLTYGLWQSNYY